MPWRNLELQETDTPASFITVPMEKLPTLLPYMPDSQLM